MKLKCRVEHTDKSFLHTLRMLMNIQLGLAVAVLIMFMLLTFHSAVDRQRTALGNYTTIYASQIENRLQQALTSLSELVYDNADLNLLCSSDSAMRQYAAVALHDKMVSIVNTTDDVDMIVVAEAGSGIVVDARSHNLSLAEAEELRAFAMEQAAAGEQVWRWEVYQGETRTYLYRALIQDNRAVLTLISTDTLLSVFPADQIPDTGFLLVDGEGTVLDSTGSGVAGLDGQHAKDRTLGMMQVDRPFSAEPFILRGQQSAMWLFWQISSYVPLVLGTILLMLAFNLYYARRTRRELLVPMGRMTRDMQKIQDGNLDLRIATASDSVEFRTLVDSFNHLLDEILHLKISSYEKQLALLDAEQKYIRLQIRPHFFLNAMSTIAGLNRSGQSDAIEAYINALSKNIRYMFASGLYTVPLQEEIRHVENYFAMQELKYPESVLYFVEMDEAVREWPVPQMLIHTLVENEYKYAVAAGHQTMVLIKLQQVQWQGEEMLLVQVEDDGKGYPQEVMDALNGGTAAPRSDGTRVGLASIRRMLELMYDRENLFVLSNVEPHGAMSRAYIPRNPLHEISPDRMREADI